MSDGERFDAFISYSHAADGKLAPELQRGLQRLAKKVFQRRALRVFRDETGLSTNPHLWGAIEEALDASEWFVLLASPGAAASDWVAREVETWLSRKPLDHVLVVVTDGHLAFSPDGPVDRAVTDCLPAVLVDALEAEPRWLDMRWCRQADQLDLRNGRFRAAVADLAAPIHGVPKDELEGEDVRQQRRARRLAISGVVAIALLTVVSLVGAVVALQQRATATRQRDVAEAQRVRADEASTRATSKALAAQAAAISPSDVDLGLLLAVEGYQREASLDTETGLLTALDNARGIRSIERGLPAGLVDVEPSPDGSTVYAIDGNGDLLAIDTSTWAVTRTLGSGFAGGYQVTISGDGTRIAVVDDEGATVVDVTTAEVLAKDIAGENAAAAVLDADGTRMAISRADTAVVEVVDVDSGAVSLSLPASDGVAAFLTGNRMAVASLGSTVVSVYALDGDGQTPLLTKNGLPPGGGLVVSPDGKSMMVGGLTGTAQLVDAATLEPISSVYSVRGSRLGDLFFSPDSRYVGLGSDDGSIRFFDLQLDVQVMEVTGLTGLVTGGFVGDTSFLIASFTDELVVVGDLTDLTQIGTSAIATNSVSGVVALTDDRELVSTGQAGSQIGPRGKPPTAHSSFTGSVRATSVNADQSKAAMYVIEADPETGEATSRDVYVVDLPDFTVQQTISFGDTAVENLALSPDGSLVAVGQRDGSLSVYDAISGEQVLAPRQIDVYPCCLGAVVWSPDGSRLYVGGQDGTLRALDAADWSVVGEVVLAPDRSALRITRWSPDGTMLIVPCECGSVFLVDPDAMTVIGEPFTAAGTQLQNAVLIDDQQRLVAISRDGSMRLWDVATHRSIGPAMRAHTLFALALDKESETEVVSGGAVDGIVTHWTFDPKEWVARACEVAGRNLTKDEWDRYVGDDYHATCEQFPDGT